MPVSARLDKETEALLERASRLLGTSKSEVIKKSIKQYCEPLLEEKKQSLYDFLKESIDKLPGSGRGDLSIRHREIIYEMLLEKRRQGRL